MNSFSKVTCIFGVGRSGTSWLGQILDSSPDTRFKMQPLFSYAFKDRLNARSSKIEMEQFFKELYHCKNDFLDQSENREKGFYPGLDYKKENPDMLVFKEMRYLYMIPALLENLNYIKIVGIVRHPCAVISSWLKAPKEFNSNWNYLTEWEFGQSKNQFKPEEYYGYSKWKEALVLFSEMEEKYPKNFLIVRYEDLVKNSIEETKRIYSFCGLAYTKLTGEFLVTSQNTEKKDAYAVYRKNVQVDEWKEKLPLEIQNKILMDLRSFSWAQKYGYKGEVNE